MCLVPVCTCISCACVFRSRTQPLYENVKHFPSSLFCLNVFTFYSSTLFRVDEVCIVYVFTVYDDASYEVKSQPKKNISNSILFETSKIYNRRTNDIITPFLPSSHTSYHQQIHILWKN